MNKSETQKQETEDLKESLQKQKENYSMLQVTVWYNFKTNLCLIMCAMLAQLIRTLAAS